MAIEGLTEQQSDFIERFLKVPKVFKRKEMKQRRKEATEQFRLFNAERDLILEDIKMVEDAAMRSMLRAQVGAAEAVIEKDPKNLDFAGGHKQLEEAHGAMLVYVRQQDAKKAFAQMQKAMERMDKEFPLIAKAGGADGQSDIALTWGFVQDKFNLGIEQGDARSLDQALKAMGRLQVMMRNAEKAQQNPFDARLAETDGAVEKGKEGLDPKVLDARRRLSDTFNQLDALRTKLKAQFGEGKVPLALQMGCTAVQTKLDAAADAELSALAGLADDAAAAFAQVQRDATRLIAEAQAWTMDHEAFQVRYGVMLAHVMNKDTVMVKPEFDRITTAYDAARQKAASHDYVEASRDIAVVRNDLKDALDFADSCANYAALVTEREALLATLPAPATYSSDALRTAHADAQKLLADAKVAHTARQPQSALALMNRIPDAVADILEKHRFDKLLAKNISWYMSKYNALHNNYSNDVRKHLQAEIVATHAKAAEANAEGKRGGTKSAAGKFLSLGSYLAHLVEEADYIKAYLAESAAFATRLRETKDRDGAEGRVAIESYYQALVADEAKRASAETKKDFKTANAMCLRAKADHAAMMKLADEAKDYLAKKKLFDDELAKLTGKKSADALEAKATAQTMLANAVAATTRGNWTAGSSLLESATLEIKRAVSDAETAEVIDGIQNTGDGVTLTSDTEFKTAYNVFLQIKNHVAGLDAQNLFAAQLKAADAKAKSAEPLIAKDLAKAQQTLDAAVQDCRNVALKITAAASYAAQLANTKTIVAEAKGKNADKVIDTEVREAEQALKNAGTAAKSPALDFPAAIGHLATAQAKAQVGIDTMAAYTGTIKDARVKIAQGLQKLAQPKVATYMADQSARLAAVRDQMNTDLAARRLAAAIAQAQKGLDLQTSFVAAHADCVAAVDDMAQYVKGKTGIEMTHAVTTEEATEFNALITTFNEMMGKGNFKVALGLSNDAYWLMRRARKKAESFDLYLPVKVASTPKLEALEDRSVVAAGPGHDAVLALRATYNAAIQKEDLGNYTGAKTKLDTFVADCDAAALLLDKYDRYVLLKTKAQEALAKIKAMASPALEPLLVRLEGKDRNAERKGNGFEFDVASQLYEELAVDCVNAKASADRMEEFGTVTSQIKVIAEGDSSDLLKAIGTAEATLKALKAEPSAMYVIGEMKEAGDKLRTAREKAEEDFAAARKELEVVVDACIQMTLLMAQYDRLNEAAGVARKLAEKLLTEHPLRKLADHATYAKDDIETRMAALEVSMMAARTSKANRPQTQTDVEATISALRDLQKVLDDQLAYAKAREPVEKELAVLEKSAERHLIRADLTETRKLLDTAATRAADRNHTSAEQQIKAAAVQIDMAKLRAKLASNTKPSPDDLKKILAGPDGIQKVDDIVKNLEKSVQRQVMAVAFEARFGCSLEMTKPGTAAPQVGPDGKPLPIPAEPEDRMDLPAINIRKFYEDMSKLPPSDTLDNDSMIVFLHKSGTQEGSAYSPGAKKVLMREGDESRSQVYAIAMEHEIGTIDPKAVPKPGEARTAFSWNTLHEVGHAVDDKLSYMKKHGERLAGWKVYGANVGEAAAAIAGKFTFDANYVAEYMLSKKGAKLPVPEPVGCEPEVWQRRMEECRIFVDRARCGNNPWSSASIAGACAVGSHTYVESYEGNWARYLTAERRFAVSGYQFRAPGEWFSELYAALHSGRLNDQHPHKAEFEAL